MSRKATEEFESIARKVYEDAQAGRIRCTQCGKPAKNILLHCSDCGSNDVVTVPDGVVLVMKERRK